MTSDMNQKRAARGVQALCVHPDYPGGIDTETAASDIIADILHARYGVYDRTNEDAAQFLLDHAFTAWMGETEDEDG